jgi:hypothetical protein
MQLRRPHRFFVGLFAVSLGAIQLAASPESADAAPAKTRARARTTAFSTSTDTSTIQQVPPPDSTDTSTVVTPPPAPVATDTSTVVTPPPAPVATDTSTVVTPPPAPVATDTSTVVTPPPADTSVSTGTNTATQQDPPSSTTDTSVTTSTSTSTNGNLSQPSQTKEKGSIAVCDAPSPDGKRRAGFGYETMSWPQGDPNSEKNRVEAEWINRYQNQTVNSDAFNHVHAEFSRQNSPDPTKKVMFAAFKARAVFFAQAFGNVAQNGTAYPAGIPQICHAKQKTLESMKTWDELFAASQNAQDAAICGSSFQNAQRALKQALEKVKNWKETTRKVLKGSAEYWDPIDHQKYSSNLENLYLDGRKKDFTEYSALKAKLNAADNASLQNEIMLAWGSASERSLGDTTKVDPKGIFSKVLLQVRTEYDGAEAEYKALEKYRDQLNETGSKCSSVPGNTVTGIDTSTSTSSSTITGPVTPPAPASSVTDTSAGTTISTGTGTDTTQVISTGTTTGTSITSTTSTSTDSKAPPVDPGVVGPGGPGVSGPGVELPPDGPNAKGPNAVGSFLKNNWMWLAGGAVLVGGGIYVYKKYKDNKKKKEYWDDDMNFMPPRTPSPGPNANAATTSNVPAGARLILTTGVGGASVGQAMPAITVALIDSNNNLLSNVTGPQVNVSCLTPNPCSMTGAMSITMTGGQATFTGLVFNQPDRGVTLQFNTPNAASVTTPGTFNVSGAAQRQ